MKEKRGRAGPVLKKLMLYIEDILILSGLAVIVTATFYWSGLAGMYALGACLLGLGVYFAAHPPGRG